MLLHDCARYSRGDTQSVHTVRCGLAVDGDAAHLETCVTTIGVSNALWAYLQQHAQMSDETPTAIIERLLAIALPQPQTLSVSVIVRADR